MGLLKAAGSAVGGVLADQWKDFYTGPDGLAPTAALFPAVKRGTNFGRGSNTKGSLDVITNGSKIIVPQGYGLVFMEGGAFTAFVAEPGVYEWNSSMSDSCCPATNSRISLQFDRRTAKTRIHRPNALAFAAS